MRMNKPERDPRRFPRKHLSNWAAVPCRLHPSVRILSLKPSKSVILAGRRNTATRRSMNGFSRKPPSRTHKPVWPQI